VGCFSFYPGKNLGAYGEGGGITTDDEAYANHLKRLRNHASIDKYYHEEVGYNMRMDGIQGAVLNVKLKYIDEWNKRRKVIAEKYQQNITNPKIKMQVQPDYSDSVYHLFVITTDDRDQMIKHLNDNNIFPGLHYPVPCHLQNAYANLKHQEGDFPNTEYLAKHCLSLPMFAELTDEEVDYVIHTVNNY